MLGCWHMNNQVQRSLRLLAVIITNGMSQGPVGRNGLRSWVCSSGRCPQVESFKSLEPNPSFLN